MENGNMNDILVSDFQSIAAEYLARNKSLLDIISKLQSTNAKINRTVVKAVTSCGCIEVNAHKQPSDNHMNYENLRVANQSHISGQLCDKCRDFLENTIGENLFYLASLCNALDVDLYDVILKERDNLATLGKFNLK